MTHTNPNIAALNERLANAEEAGPADVLADAVALLREAATLYDAREQPESAGLLRRLARELAPGPAVSAGVSPATDQTPSRRAGLRDEIAAALYAHDHPGWRVPMHEADVEPVYVARAAPVLYREWPWLRAEAEDAAPVDRAAVARVRVLHQEYMFGDDPQVYCAHCNQISSGWVPWPCPTVKALDGELRRLAGEAHTTTPDTETPDREHAFVRRVLEIFSASHADAYGDLFWRVDDGQVRLYANVSDVFAWGGSDCEPITPDTLPALEAAYEDLKAVGAEEFTAELYAARQRGMRPQGAAYPSGTHEAWRKVNALYDACGPERQIGLGNPKPTPASPAAGAPHTKETDNPRAVCVCGHTRGEHLTVSGRLLCDSCDPNSTDNLVCRGFDAL